MRSYCIMGMISTYARLHARSQTSPRAQNARTHRNPQTTTHADDTLTYSKDDNKTSETSRNTLAADRAHSKVQIWMGA